MMPSNNTPVSAPNRETRPPWRLIPPITAAEKTKKIKFWPCADATDASRPASIRLATEAKKPAAT